MPIPLWPFERGGPLALANPPRWGTRRLAESLLAFGLKPGLLGEDSDKPTHYLFNSGRAFQRDFVLVNNNLE
eukprot:4608661-Prorocentrum_lima.AAC.1